MKLLEFTFTLTLHWHLLELNVKFPTQFCLESISDGFSATESREVSLNGYAYDFSVDYNSVEKSDMLNIYMYLMTKNNMKNSYYVLLNL